MREETFTAAAAPPARQGIMWWRNTSPQRFVTSAKVVSFFSSVREDISQPLARILITIQLPRSRSRSPEKWALRYGQWSWESETSANPINSRMKKLIIRVPLYWSIRFVVPPSIRIRCQGGSNQMEWHSSRSRGNENSINICVAGSSVLASIHSEVMRPSPNSPIMANSGGFIIGQGNIIPHILSTDRE